MRWWPFGRRGGGRHTLGAAVTSLPTGPLRLAEPDPPDALDTPWPDGAPGPFSLGGLRVGDDRPVERSTYELGLEPAESAAPTPVQAAPPVLTAPPSLTVVPGAAWAGPVAPPEPAAVTAVTAVPTTEEAGWWAVLSDPGPDPSRPDPAELAPPAEQQWPDAPPAEAAFPPVAVPTALGALPPLPFPRVAEPESPLVPATLETGLDQFDLGPVEAVAPLPADVRRPSSAVYLPTPVAAPPMDPLPWLAPSVEPTTALAPADDSGAAAEAPFEVPGVEPVAAHVPPLSAAASTTVVVPFPATPSPALPARRHDRDDDGGLRVQLGFRDGTMHVLPSASEQARALQKLARILLARA